MLTYYMACDGDLTFEKLFLSNSGWERVPIGMCGIRYSEKYNTIIFTQDNCIVAI